MSQASRIHYTRTDEAPALATYSLLPVVQAFANVAGIEIETPDISLSGRILAAFSDLLPEDQRVPDALAELGALSKRPEANIIKLPNISASIPQLQAAISELQAKGYALPDYPEVPADEVQREAKRRYDGVKGSAVNPVLREGNSDRRAPKAVKEYARRNPHSMGAWSPDSLTRVLTMGSDDFRSNERSVTAAEAGEFRIEHVREDGSVTVLREAAPLQAGEILDATVMRKDALVEFLESAACEARESGVLFSLHLKATMMKVSDPILFGHAVRTYCRPFVEKHSATLERLGVDFNNGLGDLAAKLDGLPAAEREPLESDLAALLAEGPGLAMVNSDRGITNLHVPSDIIIDASMPAMIRESGKMWNREGQLQDALAVIPDSSYAGVYAATIDDCREHGALDPTTMGSVPNVGLMAQKAEEYGSHDKTFEIAESGSVRVIDGSGAALIEHRVSSGDVWRACQTKDAAVRDWVKLAVRRARATGTPAVFWLDETRAHDIELLAKVRETLAALDTEGLEIHVMAPEEATRFSLERIRRGEDTISVTGNVLRDYLTDLFPIIEVGTSAKMLSIVPLMEGGGLFETGAGGSAPKHVQQFVAENYLRWDSLGEFLALAVSFEHLAEKHGNPQAALLAKTLDEATGAVLDEGKSPSRKLGGLDNRGSHFFLALYWARALATQEADAVLRDAFSPLAEALAGAEARIVDELVSVQGQPVEIGGYYRPDDALASSAMRPSATFNRLIDEFGAA